MKINETASKLLNCSSFVCLCGVVFCLFVLSVGFFFLRGWGVVFVLFYFIYIFVFGQVSVGVVATV